MFYVVFRTPYSVVDYLYVSFSGLITSVGEESRFFCYRVLVKMLFLFGEVFSCFWCLGSAVLFYCGTNWAFNIIIYRIQRIAGLINVIVGSMITNKRRC